MFADQRKFNGCLSFQRGKRKRRTQQPTGGDIECCDVGGFVPPEVHHLRPAVFLPPRQNDGAMRATRGSSAFRMGQARRLQPVDDFRLGCGNAFQPVGKVLDVNRGDIEDNTDIRGAISHSRAISPFSFMPISSTATS